MFRDFTQLIRNIDGVAMRDGAEPDAPNITLGKLAVEGLLYQLPGEQIADSEKLSRWQLAKRIAYQKIRTINHTQLTGDELALVRAQIGKRFVIALAAPAFELLDADHVSAIEDTAVDAGTA